MADPIFEPETSAFAMQILHCPMVPLILTFHRSVNKPVSFIMKFYFEFYTKRLLVHSFHDELIFAGLPGDGGRGEKNTSDT